MEKSISNWVEQNGGGKPCPHYKIDCDGHIDILTEQFRCKNGVYYNGSVASCSPKQRENLCQI